jgi:aminoglycoside phosphotransferase (APT) family kinase protein
MIRSVTEPPPISCAQAEQLLRTIRPDWRLVQLQAVSGATSARVSRLDAEDESGQRTVLLLHQYGAANLKHDPHAAQSEFHLLELLHAAGIAVPRPYLADESGAIVPRPCLLQEFVDGDRIHDPPDLAAFLTQLAATLAAVHDARIPLSAVPFLADVRDYAAVRIGTGSLSPDDFAGQTQIRAALRSVWPPPQVNEPRVLHGDYWPGNVLWRDGRLVAVIDWEDALFGDPLADLGVARLEIAWIYGQAAMETFTRHYQSVRPVLDTTTLPSWDLWAALRACEFPMSTWQLPSEQVATMRAGLEEFAARALEQV